MDAHKLLLKQVTEKLKPWSSVAKQPRPPSGWIRTIRQALGMTTTQLAKRLGVHQSRVVHIEKAEPRDAITMSSLRKAAHAMECELVYAIVPRTSLQDIIQQQAHKIAKQMLARVDQNMLLEKQELTPEQKAEQLKDLIEELLKGDPKIIWRE